MALLEPELENPLFLGTKICQREEEKGIQETKKLVYLVQSALLNHMLACK